jgi:hypothetical protein
VLPPPTPSQDTAAEIFAAEVTVEDVQAEAEQAEAPDTEAPNLEAPDHEVPGQEAPNMEAPEIEPPTLQFEEAISDELARFDPMAFDEEVDRFVVESLEAEPISLAPSELERLDVELDSLDSVASGGTVLEDSAMAEGAPHGALESIESYLADDVAAGGHDEVTIAEFEAQPTEPDPWAGAELPEPAFGSIGWPSSEIAESAAEAPVGGVDEMSAALAWSDGEEGVTTADDTSYTANADGADVSSEEDALSAMANELRDSSSAWVVEGDTQERDEADLSARARFYGGGEANTPSVELEVSGDASDYAAELAAAQAAGRAAAASGGDAGAAIADALARVAARIRAGEVELPSEAVGASDESALAAALAALLRGPRR